MVKVEKLMRVVLHSPGIGILKTKRLFKSKASSSNASVEESAIEASPFAVKWIKKCKTWLSTMYQEFKIWWFEWKLRKFTNYRSL